MTFCIHPFRQEAMTYDGKSRYTRWSLDPEPRVLAAYDHPNSRRLVVAPEGDLFATVAANPLDRIREECVLELRRWEDHQILETILVPESGVGITGLAFSPNGRWLLCADFYEQMSLIDRRDHRVVDTMPVGECTTGLNFDPSSTYAGAICTFQGGGFACLYQITSEGFQALHPELDRTGIEWPQMDFADTFGQVLFSPNGKQVVIIAGSQWAPFGSEISVYEVGSGKRLWHLSRRTSVLDGAPSLSNPIFTPDGGYLLCGAGKTLFLFRIADGILGHRIEIDSPDNIEALAFDPGGATLWMATESRLQALPRSIWSLE